MGTRGHIATFFLLLTLAPVTGCGSMRILSEEEQAWLDEHRGKVTIASDPGYPPFDFIDEQGRPSGIARDTIVALEERLGFEFERVSLKDWDAIISAARDGRVDVLSAARETEERREFLSFTEPYLEVPNAVITRTDFSGELDLSTAADLRLAVVEGYPAFEEVEENPGIVQIPVPDPSTGLEAVAFSKVDAIILNLATASYYINRGGITNLRVAGHAGSKNLISLACRKDEPVLASILAKGLASISQERKRRIYDKWVRLAPEEDEGTGRVLAIISAALLGILILLLAVLAWNASLRSKVRQRTAELEKELDQLERKDLQLLQAQKMETVGTLAGGLAHDFNNVLVGILGSLSSMRYRLDRQGTLSREEIEKYVDLIEQSGNRASEIVRRLLSLSKRQPVAFDKVDLNDCVSRVEEFCGSTLDRSVEQTFELFPRPAPFKGDATLVEQVLLNLCLNAAQAMVDMREDERRRGGRLTVSVSRTRPDRSSPSTRPDALGDEYWSVSVADTGVGMSRETVEKIFDPFFTTKDRGTGLGLAMAFNVVQRHGGYLDVLSEEGVGTTVVFNLPVLREAAAAERPEREISLPPGGGSLVLVVDDDDSVAKVARAMLEESGYRVMRESTGDGGLEVLRSRASEIDLILLDMVMPGKSGLETYREIMAVDEAARVVLMSGFEQDPRVQQILAEGTVPFVQKPFTLETLTSTVDGALVEG